MLRYIISIFFFFAMCKLAYSAEHLAHLSLRSDGIYTLSDIHGAMYHMETWPNLGLIANKDIECLRHGELVEGEVKGSVILNTCSGEPNGMLILEDGSMIGFRENKNQDNKDEEYSHILFDGSDMPNRFHEQMDPSFTLQGNSAVCNGIFPKQNNQDYDMTLAAVLSSSSDPTTQYVELVLVNDFLYYEELGSNTEMMSAEIVNIMDGIYAANIMDPPVRFRIIDQVTFMDADPWENTIPSNILTVDENILLDEFTIWTNTNAATYSFPDLFFLFTYHSFAAVGLSRVCGMCTGTQNQGLIYVGMDTTYAGIIMGHEIGHSIGMDHDGTNGCADDGKIMGPASNADSVLFSDCSLTQWTAFYGDLISAGYNCTGVEPLFSSLWENKSSCGNGIVEVGEECDCGSFPCSCCDTNICLLKDTSTCSDMDACCDPTTCEPYISDFYQCRISANDCDLPEYCDGISSECPIDLYKGPSTSCVTDTGYNGYCLDIDCASLDEQCEDNHGIGYTSCSWNIIKSNGVTMDSYCSNLRCCYNDEITTLPGIDAINGASCDINNTNQCYSGSCYSSNSLIDSRHYSLHALSFGWTTEILKVCDCNLQETYAVTCVDQDMNIVSDEICPYTTKPYPIIDCLVTNPKYDCNTIKDKMDATDILILVSVYIVVFGTIGFFIFYIFRKSFANCFVFCCINQCRRTNEHRRFNDNDHKWTYKPYTCQQCHFKNTFSDNPNCLNCERPKPRYVYVGLTFEEKTDGRRNGPATRMEMLHQPVMVTPPSQQKDSVSLLKWTCAFCTYDNPGKTNRCYMCNQLNNREDRLSNTLAEAIGEEVIFDDDVRSMMADWRAKGWTCEGCGHKNDNIKKGDHFKNVDKCVKCKKPKMVEKKDQIVIHM